RRTRCGAEASAAFTRRVSEMGRSPRAPSPRCDAREAVDGRRRALHPPLTPARAATYRRREKIFAFQGRDLAAARHSYKWSALFDEAGRVNENECRRAEPGNGDPRIDRGSSQLSRCDE